MRLSQIVPIRYSNTNALHSFFYDLIIFIDEFNLKGTNKSRSLYSYQIRIGQCMSSYGEFSRKQLFNLL